MFGGATITSDIGPHSSLFIHLIELMQNKSPQKIKNTENRSFSVEELHQLVLKHWDSA